MNNQKRHLTAAAGFVMMFFAGVFYAWSLFRIALSEFFPAWTASDYSLNFTIFIICFCSAGSETGRPCGWAPP